ncbi:MAG: hypothetical protein GAK31_02478 [Stenotrophomonas maltophilia]|uniref:YdbS-like PH domain-containing protein n=1 Tax=Stenotrophomonas maltophilia TaxID=40324 RepID=A0A7V8JLK6_STEMA|nr:MAG: hypothetical protein GAK31_02478 [Stenotrophomonas maltophilia]
MSLPPPLPSPVPAGNDADTAPEHRLHPLSWLFVLLMQLRHYLVPLIALVVFGQHGDRDPMITHLVSVAVIVVLVGMSIAQYLSYRYRIGADAITVRSGVLSRNRREIPFARIHNVEVQQNPLHHVFGVAEVRLESTGGTEPETHMRVLRLDQALALEQLVRQRAHAPAAAPAAAAPELLEGAAPATAAPLPDTHEQVLLRLSTWDLVKLGLLSNRGWVLVVAGLGLLVQLAPRAHMYRVLAEGGREAFGYASHLQQGLGSTLVAVVVAALLLGWLLLRALPVALAILRYHGFTLGEQDRRLTVVSGLFSRTRSSVARRRIQAWTLQETLLQRLFGQRQLRIDSAAGGPAHGHHRALRELVPLAPQAVCERLVQHLLPQLQWPPAHRQPVATRGWWRLSLDGLLLVPLISAALTWRWGPLGLLPLAWLPVSLWAARQQMARIGWHVDARLVAVRGGWWRR